MDQEIVSRRRLVCAGAMLLLGLEFAARAAVALPLWELTGTRNHVMLLGSIHTLRPTDYPLDPAITNALKGADVVLMELDMDDLDPVASSSTIAALARDPRGRQLPELLGAAAWREAQSQGRDLGIDLAPLAGFEPWYAAVVITQLRLDQLGFDPAFGVETRMAADAKREGKEVGGLETLESQLGALDALSPAAQREFLLTTLEEAATIDKEVDGMISAWKTGDVRTLDRDLLGNVRDQPEIYRTVIVERNENFSRAIAKLANDSRDYLIVVGALHLVGPDSVLRMLARDGHEVRQIETN